MARLGIVRGMLIAALPFLGASAAQASEWHQFNIINNTSRTVTVTRTISRCVTETNFPSTIGPRQTATVKWEDTNSLWAYNGYSCINKDKFVAFSVSIDGGGNQYGGYLGITHRRLSGSSWYNGQFYAQDISVNEQNGGISGSDGSPPPSNLQALCSHDNNCFGPWSEMEMDNKDSYNWQRSYKTEDGWAFQINENGG